MLRKIPTIKQNRVLLVDVPRCPSSAPKATTPGCTPGQGSQFCNLNIGDLEGRLDPQLFLRVHRSYIVNLSHVDEIVRDDGRMTLRMMGSTPVEIPVSRSSAPRLLEQLGLGEPCRRATEGQLARSVRAPAAPICRARRLPFVRQDRRCLH